MIRIFFSFDHADQEEAEYVISKLKVVEGVSIWSSGNIKPGEDIEKIIIEKIRWCDIVIVLVSPQSIGSAWVVFEVVTGIIHHKIISPILLNVKPNILPIWLQRYLTIDYSDVDACIEERMKEIEAGLEG